MLAGGSESCGLEVDTAPNITVLASLAISVPIRTSLAISVPTYLTDNLGFNVPHWQSRFLPTSLTISVPTYLTDNLVSYVPH